MHYKYFEINKKPHNIRCKLYADNIRDIQKVVIFCHGFAGHKDNGACEKFAGRLLSKYKGTAVLIFNWPCHGDDVKKKLTLQDCLDYLTIVLDYVRETYRTDEIFSYATSFGGYLVLRYISQYGNPFRKISLRCPAVNMYEVLTRTIMKGTEYDRLAKGESVQVGFDRKIEVNPQFLRELQEADIQQTDFLDYAEDILILHGTKDEVVPYDTVFQFADNNLIEFLPVPNADHRFQNPPCMETATKAAISFFGF